MVPSWDAYFITMCYLVAMRSKDTRTKIGAVVVDAYHHMVSSGYNGFARGLNDHCSERYMRGEKQLWTEHAERNAIYNAARCGTSLRDATMYTQGIPCMECSRAVIQAGIFKIVCHQEWMDREDPERYVKPKAMLLEAGVSVVSYSGPLVEIIPRNDDLNPLTDFEPPALSADQPDVDIDCTNLRLKLKFPPDKPAAPPLTPDEPE